MSCFIISSKLQLEFRDIATKENTKLLLQIFPNYRSHNKKKHCVCMIFRINFIDVLNMPHLFE